MQTVRGTDRIMQMSVTMFYNSLTNKDVGNVLLWTQQWNVTTMKWMCICHSNGVKSQIAFPNKKWDSIPIALILKTSCLWKCTLHIFPWKYFKTRALWDTLGCL